MTKIMFRFNHPNHQQLVASSTWQNLFFFLINHENFLTVVKNLRSKIQNQLSCPQSLSGYSFSMISIIISNIFPEIAKFINILKTKYAFFPDESYFLWHEIWQTPQMFKYWLDRYPHLIGFSKYLCMLNIIIQNIINCIFDCFVCKRRSQCKINLFLYANYCQHPLNCRKKKCILSVLIVCIVVTMWHCIVTLSQS